MAGVNPKEGTTDKPCSTFFKIFIYICVMNEKLKNIIFNKLYHDLKHLEIIPYNNSIWFIDREKQYWYFEYDKSGTLWWRYTFFIKFFSLFCMIPIEFECVIREWVEEVLNCKVETTGFSAFTDVTKVKEVLNSKVESSRSNISRQSLLVQEVLNYKVENMASNRLVPRVRVEEILNSNPV